MILTAVELVLSIGLGLVFLASAIPKLRDPRRFVLATIEYRILPPDVSRLYASVIPPLELFGALALLGGIGVRSAALLIGFLLVNFLIALSVNIARGREIDCHCFGAGTRRRVGWSALWQDLVLLAIAVTLIVSGGSWIGVAAWSPLQRLGSGIALGGCLALATVCTIWLRGPRASCTAFIDRRGSVQGRRDREHWPDLVKQGREGK